jgi:hypothetical protein
MDGSFILPLANAFVISVTIAGLNRDDFWHSLGISIHGAIRDLGVECAGTEIRSKEGFLNAFRASSWDQEIIILFDELGDIYRMPDDIRDEFISALRTIKDENPSFAIRGVISAGTFSILQLNPSTSDYLPFNITIHVMNPYFTLDETTALFDEFADKNYYKIEPAVIKDVWEKASGFVAQFI